MSKIKKKNFIFVSLLLAVICGLAYCLPSFINYRQISQTTSAIRTIEVKQNEIDYQSIFDEFEDAKLETEGSLTTFEGVKPISIDDLSALDNLSESDLEACDDISVKYNFSYDAETGMVTLSAATISGDAVIEVDEIQGVAFYNEYGAIDALLEVDGDYILLSEMQDYGMIANCGWFKKLIKKIVVAAVAVVAVAAVATVVVASCGAGLGACIAAGAIAGGITGGVAGGIISYQETGEVKWEWVAIGATAGAAIGAATGWVVGSACGATTAVPKYGDSFGKYGTYVKNPKIKVDWTKTTAHGAERMQERNMTKTLVEKVVSSGKAFSQNSGSKYLFLSKDGAAVLSSSGELITTYSSANFTDDIIALLKLLGVL